MTVIYSQGVFEIYDGEETVADLTAAKGSAPADTDTTYIYTNSTPGILGITSGETMAGSIYVGRNPAGTKSAGVLRIYGGGTYQMASSVTLQLIPGYGELETSATTTSSKAKVDANQCANTIYLTGGLDCDLLEIANIKSGGVVDLSDATGTLSRVELSGYGGAEFTIQGVPGEGFFARALSLGRAISGFWTGSSYPDLNMVTDAAIVEVAAERSSGLSAVAVPGRKAARVRGGAIAPTTVTVTLRAASGKVDDIMQAMEYLQAEEVTGLLVIRSHGSTFTYPSDVLMRARIAGVAMQYPPGGDYRDMTLKFVEET